jgi:three-Cys-motif partner protein
MTKNDKTRQLFGGDWTEEKLAILKKYLCAYNTVLKKQHFTRIYVDAFAGTGYRVQRQNQFQMPDIFAESNDQETQELLKGSAKLALEVEPPFDRFVFVETDAAKVSELQALKAKHPDKADQIDIVCADANEFLQEYCAKQNWRQHRAMLFLDPFATEVVWTTVQAVAATKAMDVWILFPLMAVNRLLAKDVSKSFRKRLDTIFGTTEWFERFYRTTKEDDIFGQSLETVRKACDFKGIGDFYAERLRAVFAGVAAERCVWDNSRGSPLFQFFFAAGNEKGAPIAVGIADDILRKKDR